MNKQEFLKILGKTPEKVSLQTQIISTEDCLEYTRQKI